MQMVRWDSLRVGDWFMPQNSIWWLYKLNDREAEFDDVSDKEIYTLVHNMQPDTLVIPMNADTGI